MNEEDQDLGPFPSEESSAYTPVPQRDGVVQRLSGMYQNWFLEYASYVILDRAVPYIGDGLKPVQRRILYSMKRMDDGRFSKVANIVGHTMQFHPHGDASIYGALVQMGQKDLLVDCQGNWGNILTGDMAAAPRYIEARLSKFALDILFNAKTTEWKLSYDGRNREPVVLPVKFPLLLAQGAEGIAVGLSSRILPHNLGELCDAAIHYLKDEPFVLYPDFQTGGSIDVSKYNDGRRGGTVRIRAKIEKIDNKTLVIREIPFGKTTSSVIESIVKAIDKGKIKVKKVDDNTSGNVEIVISLAPGTSSDKTIDALYAFTDCETSISPNCCVIDEGNPCFLSVTEVLQRSVDSTLRLLQRELEIRRDEIMEQLHYASLEQIFIEQRIYKDKDFENAASTEMACTHIRKRLEPFASTFIRPLVPDDILRLLEIKMARILKFNKEKAEAAIAQMKEEIDRITKDLGNMTEVTCNWFHLIKERYASLRPRRTVIASFDTIEASKVAEANQKLYVNREEGFIGTSLKKDEFVSACSDLDDIILFYKDGTYKVVHVAEKLFVGETEKSRAEGRKAEILHVAVYKRGDLRTTYNVIYRDGKKGSYFMKRFHVNGIILDREYDMTAGTVGSRVCWFSANANGEAETVKVQLKPAARIKKMSFDISFADLAIKGRKSKGNLVTHNAIYRILLKSKGSSTLGGRQVWYDADVCRINYEGRGTALGEFSDDDRILVILPDGTFYFTDTDASNHYETNLIVICKFDSHTVWTAVFSDASRGHVPYIKRFQLEYSGKRQNLAGEEPGNRLMLLTSTPFPLLQIQYGGKDHFRQPDQIDAEQFALKKGWKAHGKRLSPYEVESLEELPPLRLPEPSVEEEHPSPSEDIPNDSDDENPLLDKTDDELRDEQTGQLRLF